jgi:sulfonate transport system substrate-binding protein
VTAKETTAASRIARLGVALAVLGALAGLLVAGSSATSTGSSRPTLIVGQQESGIVSLFKQSGALNGAAYNVKFAYFPYGPPLVQAAAAGQIDLGDVGDVPPINGAGKDPGFKVIAAEVPPSFKQVGDYIIVPKGSKIETLAELRGKTVGVPEGSSAHGFLLNAVTSVGLSPTTVKFVNLAPAALQAAFASGDIDAAAFWNPQVTLDVENDGARILALGRPPLDPDVSFYVGADKDLTDPARKAMLTDLLERLAKAYQWGDDHPSIWTQDVEKETGADAKSAAIDVANGKILVRYVTPAIVKAEQTLATTFYQAKQITKPVDVSTIVDNLLPPTFTTSSSTQSN